jgi:hypothetical protein
VINAFERLFERTTVMADVGPEIGRMLAIVGSEQLAARWVAAAGTVLTTEIRAAIAGKAAVATVARSVLAACEFAGTLVKRFNVPPLVTGLAAAELDNFARLAVLDESPEFTPEQRPEVAAVLSDWRAFRD